MSAGQSPSAGQPPTSVLRAFGADQPPRRLTGGQGMSWISGDIVLKQNVDPLHEWLAEALDDISLVGFRIATPVRTVNGTVSWEGWAASRWVEGGEPDRTSPAAWLQIIEAGRAFHHAVAHLPRPAWLDARDDRWAVADRIAWGETSIQIRPEFENLGRRLRAATEPLAPRGASQIVHGDLTGNVLVSPTLLPAIIDVSPYWRPTEYAEGVVIADALCWHRARPSLLDQAGVSVAAVARALLFRMATTSQAAAVGDAHIDIEDETSRYEQAARSIGI